VLSQTKAGMTAINSAVLDDKITAVTNVTVIVNDAEHLKVVIANLRKVSSVLSVDRSIK
jgi:GTP diphosphokinase / guanosine-3',5'-bis(diphosphate) 3'-diphosphatase